MENKTVKLNKQEEIAFNKITADIEKYLDKHYFHNRVSFKRLCYIFRVVEKKPSYLNKEKNYKLYYIQEYLYNNNKRKYTKLNKFFNDFNQRLREKASKSPLWKKNLNTIMKNSVKNSNTGIIINRKKAYPIFEKAYNYTLNQYDGSENTKNSINLMSWISYWSLISFNRVGKITGVYLLDAVDRKYFWEYIRKNYTEQYSLWLDK